MNSNKIKIIPIVLGTVAISSISIMTLAANGFVSSQSPSVAGSEGTNAHISSGGHKTNGHNIGANGYSSGGRGASRFENYSPHDSYFVVDHKRVTKPFWFNSFVGAPLPPQAVAGGKENGHPLFICRGHFNGGVHPGKIVAHTCHISWGGKEIALPRFQVLVSPIRLNWVPGSNGFVPKKAIKGGYEANRKLYICQANYNGGIHPGKIVGQVCDIAWGGKEISLPQYKILVR